MRTWRLDLGSDPHAPRLARHSLRDWLDLVACTDDTKTDVTILVSDLVTQAVASDATHVTIRAVFDDGRLRIDVHAQHDPTRADITDKRPADARSDESFSDRVTAAVADAWGRDRLPHETHTWADVLC